MQLMLVGVSRIKEDRQTYARAALNGFVGLVREAPSTNLGRRAIRLAVMMFVVIFGNVAFIALYIFFADAR